MTGYLAPTGTVALAFFAIIVPIVNTLISFSLTGDLEAST